MSWVIALAFTPFVMALLVIGFRDPMRVLLPAYAAVLPFGSAISAGPSAFGSLSSLMGLALGIALLARLMTVQRGNVRIPATVPVWLLFLGVVGATVFWSIAPRATALGFANLASLVILYVLIALSRADRSALSRTEKALVLSGVVASCYGFAQLFGAGLPTSELGGPRFGRDLLGANNTAASLILPLAVAFARTADARQPRARAAYGVAAALLIGGILLTGSRGGLLAMAGTFVAVVVFSHRGRRLLVGYGVTALVALALVLALNPAGVGERQTGRDDSSGRTVIWQVGLSACETYCVKGSGWATFGEVYALERASVPEARVLRRGTSYEPHNIWLLAAVEAGVLGLLLMCTALALHMIDALRLPAPLRVAPVAAVAGTLAAGLFLSNLEYKFFWMVLMYAALARNSVPSHVPENKRPMASTAISS